MASPEETKTLTEEQLNDVRAKQLFLKDFNKEVQNDIQYLKEEVTKRLQSFQNGKKITKEDISYIQCKVAAVAAKYKDPNSPFYKDRAISAIFSLEDYDLPIAVGMHWSDGYTLLCRFLDDSLKVLGEAIDTKPLNAL